MGFNAKVLYLGYARPNSPRFGSVHISKSCPLQVSRKHTPENIKCFLFRSVFFILNTFVLLARKWILTITGKQIPTLTKLLSLKT